MKRKLEETTQDTPKKEFKEDKEPTKEPKSSHTAKYDVENRICPRKRTRLMIDNHVIHIVYGDQKCPFRWSKDISWENMDSEIRDAFGLTMKRELQYYSLINGQDREILLERETVLEQDDFSLELKVRETPWNPDWTMPETINMLYIRDQVAIAISHINMDICNCIAEYALETLHYIGCPVAAWCPFRKQYELATVYEKTAKHIKVRFYGWTSTNDITLYWNESERDYIYPTIKRMLEPCKLYPVRKQLDTWVVEVSQRYILPWQCRSCQVWNESYRIKSKCCCTKSYRPAYEPPIRLLHQHFPGYLPRQSAEHFIQAWKCSWCSFVNDPHAYHCLQCHLVHHPEGDDTNQVSCQNNIFKLKNQIVYE